MGMVGYYLQVTPEQLEAMKASPDSVQSLIHSLTLHLPGEPGPAIVEPAIDIGPLLVVAALFIFICFAWGRQGTDFRRRRIFGWGLSLVGIIALFTAYHIQSSRQHRNFLVLKTLESTSPLNIDKNWQIVHFLLTGSAWGGEKPLYNVVLGGRGIGPNLGEGSARYLTPEEVQEVTDALAPLAKDVLRFRFTPNDLTKADLYCWHEDEGQEGIDASLDVYEEIRGYFSDAAKRGNGMLLFIL